jgi:predicted NUDIX family NTP pyrophosphohydrolase
MSREAWLRYNGEMPRKSAGILLYRIREERLEVLLAHPGGPYFEDRDLGWWSIPKGEFTDEEPLAAARREFLEETGFSVSGDFIELTPIKQKGGKLVFAWAVKGDLDPALIKSNYYVLQFPPKSGRFRKYPEIDRAQWFSVPEAQERILPSQFPLVQELAAKLGRKGPAKEVSNP